MAPVCSETRLLVVDDDSLLRELLAYLFQGTEFRLVDFPSGVRALQFLHESAPPIDAILMDLQMPGESGSALAAAFRHAAPSALLVGMSARLPSSQERAAFDAFLQKPFEVDGLREALQAATRHREEPGVAGTRGSSENADRYSAISVSDPALVPTTDSSTFGTVPRTQDMEVFDSKILTKLQASIGEVQLRQLYEMTADDVELRLTRMRQSLAAGDQKTLREEAHAIKGGCAMVGAVELSGLAAKAEISSETDSHDLAELFEACFRLRRMITIVSP